MSENRTMVVWGIGEGDAIYANMNQLESEEEVDLSKFENIVVGDNFIGVEVTVLDGLYDFNKIFTEDEEHVAHTTWHAFRLNFKQQFKLDLGEGQLMLRANELI